MSKTEEPKPESQDQFGYLRTEITKLQRENKGLKGQNALLKRKQVNPQSNEANLGQSEVGISEIKPPQAEKPEYVRPYEKFCPDCGGENPNYVKPNLFCKDCGMPEGHIDKPEEADKIKMCWNCGSTKGVLKNGSD